MEKSEWLMPRQSGVLMVYLKAMVCGSRRSSRRSASATTMADFPSGVKYRLYGSITGTSFPRLPVLGSMGVRLPLPRRIELFATQRVFRSHDGTTCCGFFPTLKWSTTLSVAGSMTYTSFDFTLGTYTRCRSPDTVGLIMFGPASL